MWVALPFGGLETWNVLGTREGDRGTAAVRRRGTLRGIPHSWWAALPLGGLRTPPPLLEASCVLPCGSDVTGVTVLGTGQGG